MKEINSYCNQPKSKEDIMGRKYGDTEPEDEKFRKQEIERLKKIAGATTIARARKTLQELKQVEAATRQRSQGEEAALLALQALVSASDDYELNVAVVDAEEWAPYLPALQEARRAACFAICARFCASV